MHGARMMIWGWVSRFRGLELEGLPERNRSLGQPSRLSARPPIDRMVCFPDRRMRVLDRPQGAREGQLELGYFERRGEHAPTSEPSTSNVQHHASWEYGRVDHSLAQRPT